MAHAELIRLNEVIRRTGLSRSRIYKLGSEGSFPRPVAIGPRSSAWVADEVERWIHERINAPRILHPIKFGHTEAVAA